MIAPKLAKIPAAVIELALPSNGTGEVAAGLVAEGSLVLTVANVVVADGAGGASVAGGAGGASDAGGAGGASEAGGAGGASEAGGAGAEGFGSSGLGAGMVGFGSSG